ncbi:uncharacterized protein LOC134826937 [Culicoides brevitarsis]|uniref:uncharacterized protein LOC134826937 n=1 Tax=Culicoides brevitarsis TaxID=469753 RepID=UPI00307C8ECC
MRSLVRLTTGLTTFLAVTLLKVLKPTKQRASLIFLGNLVIYSLTSTVVVLEEMFRETLQTLACLSVLAGAYSLHMSTRDPYRNPLNGMSLVHDAPQMATQTRGNDLTSQKLSTPPKNPGKQQQNIPLFDENNEIPDYLMNHDPIGPLMQPPRGLQDLFVGANKYDIRLQQQQKQQQPSSSQQQQQSKRSGPGIPPSMSHGIASQLMLRSQRGQRQYDVPQIECPPAIDGMERFACPSPDRQGRYRCIDDHVLCDGFIDCPGREDEDRQACMFYKTTKAHLDVLADALLRWARGR